MGIAFYTARVLLQELGIKDFGTYGVVGGIVSIFSSIRSLFASATQRFLNVTMESGNKDDLRKIFSMSILIHLLLCALFLLLVETIGLWYLNHKLVIDTERLFAANWVFQLSILTAITIILTISYDAVFIANEKMNIYAYISILDIALKLGVILIVIYFNFDKLILYSILVFIVSLITRYLSIFYCKKHFIESRFKFTWDKGLFKKMGSFAGWNFLGNSAFALSSEGLNIILNLFGGTPANAARTISYQVKNAIQNFTSNISTAVNPRITKLYTQKEKKGYINLFTFVSKISYFLLFILSFPIVLHTEIILKAWLSEIPPYTIIFVQLILIHLLVRIFHNPLDSLFLANGNIKIYQICDSFILFLNLPVSYILLKQGFPLKSVFIVMIVLETVNWIVTLLLSIKIIHIDIKQYFKEIVFPCFTISSITIILSFSIMFLKEIQDIYDFILVSAIYSLITLLSIWILGLKKKEKAIIINYINYLKKRH
jgi:O-antigen/teichoic acid export membrane protein